MRKISFSLIMIFMFLVISFLLSISDSQVMAEWNCDNITIEYSSCSGCHAATINLPYTPNAIENGGMLVEYDADEFTYAGYSISGCLTNDPGIEFNIEDRGSGLLYMSIAGGPIPAGSSGCLFEIILQKINPDNPNDPEVCIVDLENDLVDWCRLPTCCHVAVSPEETSVYPGESVQFSAESFYCSEEPIYTWEVLGSMGNTCSIDGSTIDASGLYVAGNVESECTDTVKVTDTANADVQATAAVNILPTTTTTSIPTVTTTIPSTVTTSIPRPPKTTTTVKSDLECYQDTDCNDENPCTDDTCLLNECQYTNNDENRCDDGLFCNGDDTCNAGSCTNHTGDPCISPKACDEDRDVCMEPALPCAISISSETTEVKSRQTMIFTINETGDCGETDYEWSVESAIKSTIDQNGNYTAGANYNYFKEAVDVVELIDKANGIVVKANVTVSFGCCLLKIYDEQSREIEFLRSVRDHVLNKTPEGKEIIRLYYQLSPVIAVLMENDEAFEKQVKELVDGILQMVGEGAK